MATGPCDACGRPNSGDFHALVMTMCGRALCRFCDCGGNCYARHVPSCSICIADSNKALAKEMAFEAKKSMNLLDTSNTTRRWA